MSLEARVRYTKMIIRNSISVLVQEKPFHRITLTEICKRAESNRSTFYKYYRICTIGKSKPSKNAYSAL